MKKHILSKKGFTLIEVMVAASIFVIFAIGIYSGITLIFKIVFQSRMRILETAFLSEQLEVINNLTYNNVGIVNGVPNGVLPLATTTVIDGQTFFIATTIRNIDDPYDGTENDKGLPFDSIPADYKLVEMSIICQTCSQKTPIILNSIVVPKQLEGVSQGGALLIQVLDSTGNIPIVEANVTVTGTAATPNTVVHDVTGNDGFLKIVDVPTGTLSYNVNVTKPGYSSDFTMSSNINVPNPVRPPLSVLSLKETDITLNIDKLGNLGLHFLDQNCLPVSNAPFNIKGKKLIGLSPTVFKFNKNLTADTKGDFNFPDFEWDNYTITSPSFAVVGSVPAMPIVLSPGATQDATVLLQPNGSNSLLVNVTDFITGLPISNANVNLTLGVPGHFWYNQTRTTGPGFVRQANWSGGSGQDVFANPNQYFADDGNIIFNPPAGSISLRGLATSGWLESSTFDLLQASNFNNIVFNPVSQPAKAGENPISFQIATSNSSSLASWDYSGPNGDPNAFYNATNTVIWTGNNGHRYLRYKVFLHTADPSAVITLGDVAFTYTTNCIPSGQVFFGNLSAADYNLYVSADNYSSQFIQELSVNGQTTQQVQLQAGSGGPGGGQGGN